MPGKRKHKNIEYQMYADTMRIMHRDSARSSFWFRVDLPYVKFRLIETNIQGCSPNGSHQGEQLDRKKEHCAGWIREIGNFQRLCSEPPKQKQYMIVEMVVIGCYRFTLHIERNSQFGAYVYVISEDFFDDE